MTRPVLIIEDDPDISESLKYNLEREGLADRCSRDRRTGAGRSAQRAQSAFVNNAGSDVAGHERQRTFAVVFEGSR